MADHARRSQRGEPRGRCVGRLAIVRRAVRKPQLHRYWFPASLGLGIGVTAPDAGTAWFMAKAALHRLPTGAALIGHYVEDVDPQTLDLGPGSNIASSSEAGVWFPAGVVRQVQLRAARTADDARAAFVFVEDDGSARELTAHEAEVLATSFDATDGNRPYIKRRYDSRTPTGRLSGFLPQSELPTGFPVRRCKYAHGDQTE